MKEFAKTTAHILGSLGDRRKDEPGKFCMLRRMRAEVLKAMRLGARHSHVRDSCMERAMEFDDDPSSPREVSKVPPYFVQLTDTNELCHSSCVRQCGSAVAWPPCTLQGPAGHCPAPQ
jgi:hypothetical protein